MKNLNLFRPFLIVLSLVLFTSCGTVLVTSRHQNPPPPWFYPNRVELVRYVYFPELTIYYDLTDRTYIYLDAGVWVRAQILPSRYRTINLNRSKYQRVKNYRDDNIQRYHEENNRNSGRSNLNTRRSTKRSN